MDIDAYQQALRAALFARGIFGRRATRLTEELRDHYASRKDELLAEDHEDADALALAVLGKPEVIADSALASLQGSSWLARHPYLSGLGFGFLIFVVNIVLLLLFAAALLLLDLSGNPAGPYALPAKKLAEIFLNWLPSIVGVALLFWHARRYASGWKPFLAAGVALATTVFLIGVYRLPEPGLVAAPAVLQEEQASCCVILESPPLAIVGAMCIQEFRWWNLFPDVESGTFLLLFVRPLLLMSVCFGFKILVPRLCHQPVAALQPN